MLSDLMPVKGTEPMSITRRHFIQSVGVGAAAFSLPLGVTGRALGANERIRVAVVGLGTRGSGHCGWFDKIEGVEIAALCDPDEKRLNKQQKKFPKASAYTDVRQVLEDDTIDVVTIATSNHWHCLAGIWACQAGKDVYVEKPLGHNQHEQQKLVEAARKYNRIVQVGTQQRSDPVQDEIKQYLHEDKALGEIQYVRANIYNNRNPIGKRQTPMQPPEHVDYNLWLGPAADEPIYRDNLQYQWHWVWNTGSGEMGNWGVHVLDDVRNVVFRDFITLPVRIMAGGGRLVWDDAGETPNTHFVYYDTGTVPVLFDLSNIKQSPDGRMPHHKVTRNGYTVYCEGGYYSGGRGGGAAFDNDGKKIKGFSGDAGEAHAANFIDAVRHRDPHRLNADVAQGHHSTGWCNLANIALRAGGPYSREKAMEAAAKDVQNPWGELLDYVNERLTNHGLAMDSSKIKLSNVLQFSPEGERFVGRDAEQANQLLSRQYREGFTLPKVV
jgi:predicted dehydrogenase